MARFDYIDIRVILQKGVNKATFAAKATRAFRGMGAQVRALGTIAGAEHEHNAREDLDDANRRIITLERDLAKTQRELGSRSREVARLDAAVADRRPTPEPKRSSRKSPPKPQRAPRQASKGGKWATPMLRHLSTVEGNDRDGTPSPERLQSRIAKAIGAPQQATVIHSTKWLIEHGYVEMRRCDHPIAPGRTTKAFYITDEGRAHLEAVA